MREVFLLRAVDTPHTHAIVTGVAPMEESSEVDAWIGKQDMFPALLDKINLFLGERDSQETLTSA